MMHFIDYYVFENKGNSELDITAMMRKIAEKISISELNQRA